MVLASKDDGKGRCGTETVIGKQSVRDREGDGKGAEAEGGSNAYGSGAEVDGHRG